MSTHFICFTNNIFCVIIKTIKGREKMNLIRAKREEKQLSQAELGRLLGVSQQHIQRFEKDYPVPVKYAAKLAQILDIDIKELLPEELKDVSLANPEIVQIDVLDVRACCGDGIENFTENVIGQQMMTLPALRELTESAPENIKIIKAIGESMMPTIHTDDIVWIDISVKTPTSDGLYILCVGSDLLIRRIQINPFDNTATVIADNNKYLPIPRNNYRDIKVIGKVIYHMRKTA
jgi:phage repressor protein C with HTH and peptisase S24 domain